MAFVAYLHRARSAIKVITRRQLFQGLGAATIGGVGLSGFGREGGKADNWSLTHGATKYFPDLRFHPPTGTTPHTPGMLTKDLAIPWFNDFISCDETYWPTSRTAASRCERFRHRYIKDAAAFVPAQRTYCRSGV